MTEEEHAERFIAAFKEFLRNTSPAIALSTATSIFVSLVEQYAEHRGADINQSITIDGGKMRDITIGPPKDNS